MSTETLYFEVPQFKKNELGRKKYYFRKTLVNTRITRHPQQIVYKATRIWSLKDGKVRYIKNRYIGTGPDAEVDEKEFMFIQIAAMPLHEQAI